MTYITCTAHNNHMTRFKLTFVKAIRSGQRGANKIFRFVFALSKAPCVNNFDTYIVLPTDLQKAKVSLIQVSKVNLSFWYFPRSFMLL